MARIEIEMGKKTGEEREGLVEGYRLQNYKELQTQRPRDCVLDVSPHLYKRLHLSVGQLVGHSVCLSSRLSVRAYNIDENG